MPKDDPSAYAPEEIAQQLLELDSAAAVITRLEELGWELRASGEPAEEGIADEASREGIDVESVEGQEEEEADEGEEDVDVPMPMGPKPPYLTILRMKAVEKAMGPKKGKKKKKEDAYG
jgi:hypothetical protein